MKNTFALLLGTLTLCHASDEMITKGWEVAPSFPVIEVFADEPGEPDPFSNPDAGFVELRTYEADEVKRWLMESGVIFPEGGWAKYNVKTRRLMVRNTPENLDLVDAIIAEAIPIQCTIVLLEDFLKRATGQSPAEVARLALDYPEVVLGPLSSIAHELDSIERSIANLALGKPEAQRELIQLRQKRQRILRMLPESVSLTAEYLGRLSKATRSHLQEEDKDQ